MRILKRTALLLVALLMLLTLFGHSVGRGISLHLAGINNRVQRNELTVFDKLQCTVLYNSMIYIGGLPYPEAADILHHYIYGNGQDLYLEPDYLQRSPVVQSELQQMRVGERRTVNLRQQEDWRLSYAVNGFTLRKQKNKALLSQHIVFSRDRRIFTDLDFYIFKVRVPDGLVHALAPTPFTVYAEWELQVP